MPYRRHWRSPSRAGARTALFTRGAVADVDAVRELPRLPDTAGELSALAAARGVDQGVIYLPDQATETRVRGPDLSQYRILAFAHPMFWAPFVVVGEGGSPG